MAQQKNYAAGLWVLSLLFAGRVVGQAVQNWWPQPFLPPFASFQGSSLPYWILLAAQIVILLLMLHLALRVQRGTLARHAGAGRVLAYTGALYLALSLARLAIGVA